jgi:hypothetical protein
VALREDVESERLAAETVESRLEPQPISTVLTSIASAPSGQMASL